MAQPTGTDLDKLLTMLKYNLEIITDYMDADTKAAKELELTQYIQASVSFMETEGITLNYSNIDDCMLVTMYAGYLYEKRKDVTAQYPRMLRYNLNNRLFSQKVKQS